ncbi:MAG: PfkB family carbohydrate kinase [Steroidobacterales bacterium]
MKSGPARHNDPAWLQGALAGVPALSITVFGDFCLDAYWQLDAGRSELSIETGLPVQRVRQQRYGLGGAGNVVANLIDLGAGHVRAIGLIGTDPFGAELMRLLRERGADCDAGMIVDEAWQTLVYAKPFTAQTEGRRIDFGGFSELRPRSADALIGALEAAAPDSHVIVLNQQIPLGVSPAPVIARINAVISRHPRTLFLADSRHRPESYSGAALKLNFDEAARYVGVTGLSGFAEEAIREIAARISTKTGHHVFITCGEHGIVAADGASVCQVPGIQILGKTDSVGAGDTVVAAIAAMLGSRQTPWVAARVANIAAMITARKLQTTGTATPAEILESGTDPDYIYAPELAAMPYKARYVDGTGIEIIRDLPDDLDIRACIFDHDGTLSTLREGWEGIMESMMLRAILGERTERTSPAQLAEFQRDARQLIDQTTGAPTLVQMQGLAGLVRKFGFVAADAMPDAAGYKKIFNQELMAVVRERMEKLRSGQVDPAQFQVRNATLVLRELHRRGITLYLASGTDQADVIEEARALAYADYFEGRIFGATGDIRVDAKKMILDRMLRDHGLSGRQFAMFGDGPLEIRETRKRSAVAIGIASDEARGAGVNPSKRRRLVRAGADLIIADFGSWESLLRILGCRSTIRNC